MNKLIIDKIIKDALIEDNYYKDITTQAIVEKTSLCKLDLIAKEEGVLAGLEVFQRVFEILGDVSINFYKKDGDFVSKGDIIGLVKGNTYNILIGERVGLNILQRMSGIASLTYKACQKIVHTDTKILDTRKTTPNIRVLEKYAVTLGGAYNHRYNLSEGFLIKDNHIEAAGSISKAINLVKYSDNFGKKIEVETENLEQVKEALKAGADIIMLDNMDLDTMRKAVKLIGNQAISEASGNIGLDNIEQVALTGVNYISLGFLTHSYRSLDISLKNLKYIEKEEL